jgi:CRP-like cAMP-binding protein
VTSEEPVSYGGGNLVIDELPEEEWARIQPLLTVRLQAEASIVQSRDEPIETVYFPINAVCSVVCELRDGNALEVSAIGRNGAIGLEAIIQAEVASRSALCQVSGEVALLKRSQFEECIAANPAFLNSACKAFRRQIFVSQQSVACNGSHSEVERCARWILMTQDQVGRDRFPLRGEYLSIMLGSTEREIVRPMQELERLGAVSYRNGILHITGQQELRAVACECHAAQSMTAFIESSFLTTNQRRLP